MGGRTGLDYAGVAAYLTEFGIAPGAERRELFECMQACEAAALDAWGAAAEREKASEQARQPDPHHR